MAITDIFDKLVERYNSLNYELSLPATVNNNDRYKQLMKEHSDLSEKVALYSTFKNLLKQKEDNEELLGSEQNPEMKALAEAELGQIAAVLAATEEKMKALIVPKDPKDERNVFMEIRAGTGGDESAIFAADLFRMYTRYAENRGWAVEIQDFNQIGLGGYKEIVFMVKGRNVFSRLKWESGIHRVQRVPVTESSGRIHTSAATVAVLPEADETEIVIRPDEIRLDVYRASGAGGQHVNKTESAVRITHLPTGLVVTCQDEKSQHKNRERAMKVLRARLYEMMEEKKQDEISAERKLQVGSGDRSGKIRTYNFTQNRVTDHRIGLSLYKLQAVLDGDLDELIDSLRENDNREKMSKAGL
jgi:peptide chain release factor 1